MTQNPLIRIVNKTTGAIVCSTCIHAKTAYRRLVGLLNSPELKEGSGLLLDPCNQVHTFFMNYPIDIAFLDKNDQVLAIQTLRPWRISKLKFTARKVLELPSGTVQKLGIRPGDFLEVQPCIA